jgi:hypothetical protein
VTRPSAWTSSISTAGPRRPSVSGLSPSQRPLNHLLMVGLRFDVPLQTYTRTRPSS